MGREVRKVPADWEHPKNKDGSYKPLLEGYNPMNNQREFLLKLADLMEEYEVKMQIDGDYVGYLFVDFNDDEFVSFSGIINPSDIRQKAEELL